MHNLKLSKKGRLIVNYVLHKTQGQKFDLAHQIDVLTKDFQIIEHYDGLCKDGAELNQV